MRGRRQVDTLLNPFKDSSARERELDHMIRGKSHSPTFINSQIQ